MVHVYLSLLTALATVVSLVHSQGGANCSSTSLCSSSRAPCCSEYGFCGKEEFCLGGCNPLASKSLEACKPNPICKNTNHLFKDNSRILSNSTFFSGNASEYDWVVDKGNIMNTNASGGELALLLTQTNGGTRLSSTRYIHYGTVTATLKTGRWGGVVTAFITMSDIEDEIDWEFPGAAVTEAQSNFFWQGIIPAQTDGATHTGLSDTFGNFHDYTIDWQPETLTFLIDGKVVRTVKKTDNHYPSTPARVQFSIWPAGIEGSPPGTVKWAGGMINWNDPDYLAAGHFYVLVKSVAVKCSDPQRPSANDTSYVYGANVTANLPEIAFSNHSTLLNAGMRHGVGAVDHGVVRTALVAVAALVVVAHLVV